MGTTSGNWYSGEINEIGVPVSIMSDGTPKGYAFINFIGNKYNVDYIVADKAKDYQIEIYAPKVLELDKKTSAGIYINLFMGSEEDEVLFRIDSGKWKKMSYVLEQDPNFLSTLHKWDNTETLLIGRRPSTAAECKHLWRAAIPMNLTVGEHLIEVKATNTFGKIFNQSKGFRILVN